MLCHDLQTPISTCRQAVQLEGSGTSFTAINYYKHRFATQYSNRAQNADGRQRCVCNQEEGTRTRTDEKHLSDELLDLMVKLPTYSSPVVEKGEKPWRPAETLRRFCTPFTDGRLLGDDSSVPSERRCRTTVRAPGIEPSGDPRSAT